MGYEDSYLPINLSRFRTATDTPMHKFPLSAVNISFTGRNAAPRHYGQRQDCAVISAAI